MALSPNNNMIEEPLMKRPNDLTKKLKTCDPEIKNYVLALEDDNLKSQEKIAKLQVENLSYQHKIKVLEKMQPKAKLIIKGLYDDSKKKKKDKA
jgi:hypothetical protein